MLFKQITLDMKPLVEKYTLPLALSSSEHTFPNLLMWGGNGKIKLCEDSGVLYTLLDFGDGLFMFPPLIADTNGDYADAVKKADDYLISAGVQPFYRALTGSLLAAFRASCPNHVIEEDRNNYDYVYLTSDLITLRGKALHAKRNHINKFTSRYSYEYVRLTKDMLGDCLAVYDEWLCGKEYVTADMLCERDAIITAVTNMDELSIKGGGIVIDGKLAAFSLGQRISSEMAVIHIEKAPDSVDGLYTLINQQFVEHEWADVTYINREEDMGIEGMRKAKLSYRPVKFIEKYTARRIR